MLRAVPNCRRSGEGGDRDFTGAYPSAAAGDRVFGHGRLRVALQVICDYRNMFVICTRAPEMYAWCTIPRRSSRAQTDSPLFCSVTRTALPTVLLPSVWCRLFFCMLSLTVGGSSLYDIVELLSIMKHGNRGMYTSKYICVYILFKFQCGGPYFQQKGNV